MFETLDWTAWFTALVILMMIAALVRGAVRPHYIFLMALSSLMLTGIVTPIQAFAGFTNTAVLTVAALFVVASGVQRTRLLSHLEHLLLPKKGGTGRTLFRIMSSTSLMSSFLNNTPIVAMFTPQLEVWSKKIGIPVSKLLIPLSYAAIVGGTITLIGSSTNLIVSEMLADRGYAPFQLFQLAWIGIPATILVVLWFVFAGHRLLPDRTNLPATDTLPADGDINTDVKGIPRWQPELAGVYSGAYKSANRWTEAPADRPVQTVYNNRRLQGHLAFASAGGGSNWPSGVYTTGQNASAPPAGGGLGNGTSTINGAGPGTPPGRIKVEKLSRTLLILVLMIGFSASGIIPVYLSVMLAALAMVVTGAVPPAKITDAIHFPVLIVLASALGVGTALETTGLAESLAHHMISQTAGFGAIAVLIGLYLITNLLTEFVTNNAAAVLMIPVALSTSVSLGIDAQAVAVTIAVAASASFLSPIGYQTNLMVMGPGGYRFTDFFRAGLPVTIILMAVTVGMVSWLWM
ncbi:MAG: SLC13 family permease [Balneolales bacterium]